MPRNKKITLGDLEDFEARIDGKLDRLLELVGASPEDVEMDDDEEYIIIDDDE